MIYLLLSIVFSSSLFVIFKYFEHYKINTLQAIVVNYLVAFVVGMLSAKSFSRITTIPEQQWFCGAIVLGLLFVSVFFVMAMTSQKNGVSVASISGKMSVVVPILFGIILYDENMNWIKLLGITIALVAVYLASNKASKNSEKKVSLLFPVLLFIGSGVIDTALKYVEINYVAPTEVDFFSGSLFGIAAVFGMSILGYNYIVFKKKLHFKNVIAGVVLGIPNYYSIVFLIKALQNKGLESSTLFTINNVGIVILSAVLGFFIFKESFSLQNKIGIVLAILGIVLVSVA